jgi:hypothetical protein
MTSGGGEDGHAAIFSFPCSMLRRHPVAEGVNMSDNSL